MSRHAARDLLQIYAELRRLAAQKMAREQPGPTLQATALVHEAWLRLGDGVFANDLLTHETFGSSLFTAANGDTLATDITGLGTPTENPDVASVVEVHTITGGTGRFAAATGSFIRKYLLNLATGVTSGSFDGTIVIH